MAPKKGSKAQKGTKRSADSPDKASQNKKAKTTNGKAAPEQGTVDPLSATAKTDLIHYLLSEEAFAVAYPPIQPGKGEVDLPAGAQSKPAPSRPKGAQGKRSAAEQAKSEGSDQEDKPTAAKLASYPSSMDFSPFQTLVSSALLSKPISHRLCLRAIATLFNPPYEYTTPAKLEAAGYEGRRSALWDARTQHKEKTAEQLGSIVDGVRELCEDEEDAVALGNVRKEAERLARDQGRRGAKDAVVASLTDGIKGVGKGACDIFLRRIQHQWDVVFPYADGRSLQYAAELGLINLPEGVNAEDEEEKDEAQRKGADDLLAVLKEANKEQDGKGQEADRKAFVRLLDVLIGLGLEKKLAEVKGRGQSKKEGGEDGQSEENPGTVGPNTI